MSGTKSILDTLSTHKSPKAAALLKGIGEGFMFLPPYSFDLKPIDMTFAKLKALIRKAAATAHDQLWQAVGHVCDIFTEDDCCNFFKTAGYETD